MWALEVKEKLFHVLRWRLGGLHVCRRLHQASTGTAEGEGIRADDELQEVFRQGLPGIARRRRLHEVSCRPLADALELRLRGVKEPVWPKHGHTSTRGGCNLQLQSAIVGDVVVAPYCHDVASGRCKLLPQTDRRGRSEVPEQGPKLLRRVLGQGRGPGDNDLEQLARGILLEGELSQRLLHRSLTLRADHHDRQCGPSTGRLLHLDLGDNAVEALGCNCDGTHHSATKTQSPNGLQGGAVHKPSRMPARPCSRRSKGRCYFTRGNATAQPVGAAIYAAAAQRPEWGSPAGGD
mmetsp:Transcript_14648/g.32117  ORF Transcript_14648/g.32117 Transcript_14648/m.32117 type:complete len:293 (-) Transcript_14648:176-1054(-)